ncbi:MAG: alpha-amylase, partial [Tenericutes bacterium HGW-Tenericutes-3]
MRKLFLFIMAFFLMLGVVSCKPSEEEVTPTPEVDLKAVYPQNDVYYEIFVRSFADSDADGIGDLNGITQNLDYLEDLGVTALWLMPINPSPSYHGYSVTDYYDIESDYGTLADFQDLIDQAKSKDIDIIIDLVINHTSDQHPWYLSAQSSTSSEYRD